MIVNHKNVRGEELSASQAAFEKEKRENKLSPNKMKIVSNWWRRG
jgi:hypothetical protein